MKLKNVVPQPLPTGGWTLPHITNLKAAEWLLQQLRSMRRRRAWRTSRLLRFVGLGADPSMYLGFEMAFVGDAVEAFSCFALEAAVNTYGILRFGESQFYDALERLPLRDKLKRVLEDGEGVALEESHEIFSIVKRRVDSRDAIVHPKSREFHPVTHKLLSKTKVPPRPPMDRATEAVDDMNRFFQLLPTLSKEIGPILELR